MARKVLSCEMPKGRKVLSCETPKASKVLSHVKPKARTEAIVINEKRNNKSFAGALTINFNVVVKFYLWFSIHIVVGKAISCQHHRLVIKDSFHQ